MKDLIVLRAKVGGISQFHVDGHQIGYSPFDRKVCKIDHLVKEILDSIRLY